jgi:hypothetical protein
VAQLDHVEGRGYGDLSPRTGSADLISTGFGALGLWHGTDWFAVRVRVNATALLTRPTYYVENVPLGYRPASLSIGSSVGVELSIP